MAVKEITPTATEAPATKPTLNATHRCDRCGAQAYVRALLKSGHDLLFCGHHFDRYLPLGLADVLRGKVDERVRLKENRKQGSANS